MHVVINGWFCGDAASGSGQYIDHMVRYLPQAGSEVRCTLLVPADQRAPVAAAGVTLVALPLPRLPRNLAKLYWEQVIVPRAARRLKADVLWVPYWAAPLYQPCPTVVTIHDLIPKLLPAYRGGLLQRLYLSLVSATARRSTRVITVSDAGARDVITHLAIPQAVVRTVHHGPNRQDAHPLTAIELDAIRDKYDLPERYFLYLGGFDVRKNVETIFTAYRLFLESGGAQEVALVIAGRLPEADSTFAPDPRRLAADAGVSDHVHFCGWIADEDKPGLYALATAYIFPSHYEGFGMMVLEAMSAGTPVITSDR